MFVLFNMLSRKLHDFILSQVYKYTKKIYYYKREKILRKKQNTYLFNIQVLMTHTDAERCKHLIIHGNKTQEKTLKNRKDLTKDKNSIHA